jgi:hypothetical protein
VYPHPSEKIDLNTEYPCPCRRQGRLKPIILTEALGCDRCQQIFVVDESRYAIEQLSTYHPYKQVWRWTGQQWSRPHAGLREIYVPLSLIVIIIGGLSWLFFALHLPGKAPLLPWIVILLIIVLIPPLLVWLAYRR